MDTILYRGVSTELYERLSGELRPKETTQFSRPPSWELASWDDSDWNDSPINAVIEHQVDQLGIPTSGVSTTPHFERAVFYATHGGTPGFVYVIDRSKLRTLGVTCHVVNELLSRPSVPEDDEVILVSHDFGSIPREAIIEIRAVAA